MSTADSLRVVPFPAHGHSVPDQRGAGRWLRVTWHDEAGAVVLSLWREGTCVATARVDRADVPGLVTALVEGLADGVTGGGPDGLADGHSGSSRPG